MFGWDSGVGFEYKKYKLEIEGGVISKFKLVPRKSHVLTNSASQGCSKRKRTRFIQCDFVVFAQTD